MVANSEQNRRYSCRGRRGLCRGAHHLECSIRYRLLCFLPQWRDWSGSPPLSVGHHHDQRNGSYFYSPRRSESSAEILDPVCNCFSTCASFRPVSLRNSLRLITRMTAKRFRKVSREPHDLRRTCAKLCRGTGGDLEQIQLLLGHASIQTSERYLGTKQNLSQAVNDGLGLED